MPHQFPTGAGPDAPVSGPGTDAGAADTAATPEPGINKPDRRTPTTPPAVAVQASTEPDFVPGHGLDGQPPPDPVPGKVPAWRTMRPDDPATVEPPAARPVTIRSATTGGADDLPPAPVAQAAWSGSDVPPALPAAGAGPADRPGLIVSDPGDTTAGSGPVAAAPFRSSDPAVPSAPGSRSAVGPITAPPFRSVGPEPDTADPSRGQPAVAQSGCDPAAIPTPAAPSPPRARDPSAVGPTRLKRLAGLLPPLVGLLLLGGAIYALHGVFRHLSLDLIRTTLHHIPARALLASAGFTLLSYFVLSFYDRLAVLHVGHRLSFGRTAFAAFCSYVLSHNLGFAAISGAAVRFRLYGSWGLKPLEITRIIAFCSVTYLLGACALVGGVLLLEPAALASLDTRLPRGVLTVVGVGAWMVVAAYVALSARLSRVRLWRWTIPLPGVAMAVAQVAVSALDVAATAAIAYALLPAGIGLSYPAFLAIYIACYSAGLLASVPGGLGVFDGAMVLGLSPFLPAAGAVAAILVFRLFYYIVPLFIAGLLFAGHELFLRGDSLLAARAGIDRAAPVRPSLAIRESEADFSVTVATGAVILCGAMLLASGLLWSVPDDLTLIVPALVSPAPGGLFTGDVGGFARVVETIGDYVLSLIGAVLIGLAIGLSQRVTLAWGATLVMLSTAAALAALRGLPLEVPAVLILAALVIAPFRSSYYRHARLLSEPLAPATIVPLLLLLLSLLILARLEPDAGGIAANGWVQLVLGDHMSLRQRLSVGLAVLVGLVALGRLLRPGHVVALPFAGEPRARWQQAADGGGLEADGLMAGETGRALIAFRREKGLLVGLGDPVGAPADQVSAIWRLRDLALEEKRAPVFWRVGPQLLPVYADLGLVSWPLGSPDEPGTLFLCCDAERGVQLMTDLAVSGG